MIGFASVPAAPQTPPQIPLIAGVRVTLTNQALATQFVGNSNANIGRYDLGPYSQARLVARVAVGSASTSTPQMMVRYATTFSTSTASYASIGTSEVKVSLTSTGMIDSGWVDIVPAARGEVSLAMMASGGDGAADPALGQTTLFLR